MGFGGFWSVGEVGAEGGGKYQKQVVEHGGGGGVDRSCRSGHIETRSRALAIN